jgi:membrane-associated protease RseP (regulator of RpoE activity)
MVTRLAIAGALVAALIVPRASAQDAFWVSEAEGKTTVLGTNTLLRAAWMAVIADAQGHRILVGAGEPIFYGRDPNPIATVRSVAVDALNLEPVAGGRAVRVLPGKSLPGNQGLVFRDALFVKTVEYRHLAVPHGTPKTLGGELYLIGFRGTRAIVQRDVDPPQSPMTPLVQRLAAIPIIEAAPRVWEVSTRDVQVAMDAAPAIMADALSRSRVALSGENGMALEVKTPVAEARLDRRGFVITDPNLASRAGLMVGDRILQVNGTAIDGFGSLIQVYQTIRNSPSVRVVEVLIERNQKPVPLTYRFR